MNFILKNLKLIFYKQFPNSIQRILILTNDIISNKIIIRKIIPKNVKELYRIFRNTIQIPEIYLISFPKYVRTWLKALLGKIICEKFNLSHQNLLNLRKLTRDAGLPIILATHEDSSIQQGILFNQLSTEKSRYCDKKVIFLTRNIKDTLVSCYFQATKRINKFSGDISEFIRSERYGVKKIVTFYNIWYDQRNMPKEFLFIRYENIHKNHFEILQRILRFISLKNIDDNIIKNAIKFSSFNNMKKMEKKGIINNDILRPRDLEDDESYKVRKGKVGDYISYLKKNDIEYINQVINEFGCPFEKK